MKTKSCRNRRPLTVVGLIALGSIAATAQALQPLVVNPTNPGLANEAYAGASYTVPAGGGTYQDVYDGYNGMGTITHSSGTLNVSGSLIVAYSAGSNGSSDALSGSGQLSTNFLDVGYSATGTFNQTGGMATVTGGLLLGEGAGGNGTYTFSGTGATLSAPIEVLGDAANASGAFTQNGGTNTVGGSGLILGRTAATASGTYTLSGGTLQTPSVTRGPGSGTFYFNGGALQAGADSTTFMQGLTNAYVGAGGVIIDSNGHNITIAQKLGSDPANLNTSGDLTKIGAGTLTLTASSLFGRVINVNAGTLALAAGGALGPFGGQVFVDGTSNANATLTMAAGATLNPGSEKFGISGTGTMVQNGGSNVAGEGMTLGANSGSSGSYTLGGSGSIFSNDGGLTIGSSGHGTFIQNGGSNATNYVLIGAQTGSSGSYTLSGGSLYTASIGGGPGTSTFYFNGGTVVASTSFSSPQPKTAFISGLTTASVQAGGAIIDSSTYSFTIGQALVHDPALGATPDGGLTKLGSGTLTLSEINTYTGPTAVNAGTLALTGSVTGGGSVSVDGSAGATAAMSLSGTGSLSAGPATVGNSGTGQFSHTGGTFTTNGSDLIVGNNAGSNGTFNLSGAGSLSTGNAYVGQYGTGTFTQSGGTFTTNSGGVRLAIFSGSSGTYNLSGGTLTTALVAGGSGAGTFNFNGGTLQAGAATTSFVQGLTTANVQAGGVLIDSNGYDVTISQVLSHDASLGATADGGLAKRGNGMLTLTGANTYTGNTNDLVGSITVTNTTGSATGTGAVDVGTGATFGGTGSIAGALTVEAFGALAPGLANSRGKLTLGNTLNLTRNSSLAIRLGGLTAGTGYDQVAVNGAVTISGNLNLGVISGFTLQAGQTFTILVNGSNSLTTGTFANGTFGGLFYTDSQGDTFQISYAANTDGGLVPNDVTLTVLTVANVPEPSTCALLGGGMIGVLALRKRRRDAAHGLSWPRRGASSR